MVLPFTLPEHVLEMQWLQFGLLGICTFSQEIVVVKRYRAICVVSMKQQAKTLSTDASICVPFVPVKCGTIEACSHLHHRFGGSVQRIFQPGEDV